MVEETEYEQVCFHSDCYEFPREYVPRLRRFVSDVEETEGQEEFDVLYNGMLGEGFSVEELNNVVECCVGELSFECMLPFEGSEMEREKEVKPKKVEFEHERKLKGFLEGLRGNVSLGLNVVLKPRKLHVCGNSIVVAIPRELNVIYPRGSNVLIVWNKDKKSLLFFGVGSVMSDDNILKVVNEWCSDWVCFRSVLKSGVFSALVIPRQFLRYFKKDKANLFWNSGDNVVRVESNLSFQEWLELEEKKAKEKVIAELSVQSGVSEVKSRVGDCSSCGRFDIIRFWYENEGSEGIPLCSSCYSKFEHRKNMVRGEREVEESSWLWGFANVVYGELKKRFGRREEEGEVEPTI